MTEAHITVKDTEKRQATIVIQACKGLNSAKAIATFIDAHSAAEVIQFKFVEIEHFRGNSNSGKYNSVDQQNILLFTDEEGFPVRFSLPAPGESTLDEAQESTAGFAGQVKELLQSHTNLPELRYNGGGG